MEPINMTTALLLSCLIPGLGLWNIEHGKLVFFLFYIPMLFVLGVLVIMTLGIGIFVVPIYWLGGLFHTWFGVRVHNRQAAKEAGVAQGIAGLKEQVQSLSN